MPLEQSERRQDAIVLGLLVLLLTVVYFDVLFLGNNFFTRDLTTYHYPMKKVVRDTVLSGEFPYWNTQFAGGQPMAANPAYEVFYPPQWLTLIPDYNLGFRLHILLHAYLAAIGAFLFLRSRGVRPGVALIGGAAFVLGGPFVSIFNLLPFMFSVAWTPWIALFAVRYFETRRRSSLAWLILFLGMQALICEPTTLLQTWFLLGLWAAFHGWERGGDSRLASAARDFATAVGVVVAGVTLAAVQFLPALDHASDSVRRAGFVWEVVAQWSFPPLRFVELVFPNFLGLLETGGLLFWGGSLYEHVSGPYFYSVYIGLPFVLLGLAGLIQRRRGSGFVAVSIGTSVVLAMGSWTPVLRWLYDAGAIPSIRYPEKFILMGAFVLLAWGCIVLEDILRGERKAFLVTMALLAISTIVAGAVFVWGFFQGYYDWFTSFWGGEGLYAAQMARIHWLVAVVRGLAFLGVIAIARKTRSRASMALLVLVLVADLGPLGNQVNPRMPRRFFDAPPIVSEVARLTKGESRIIQLAWLDRDVMKRLPGGFESYWFLRNGLVPSLNAVWGIPSILEWDIDETHLSHTREFMMYSLALLKAEPGERDKWRDVAVRQLAGMCNVGVVAKISPDLPPSRAEVADPETARLVDVVPVSGGPRYYFASEMVVVRDVKEMFEHLVDREWSSRVAFVYEGGARVAAGTVDVRTERPSDVVLEAEAFGEGTLVASVTRHKYWRAFVDGAPVPIRVVNEAFQGIPIPPGRHVVELRYRNPLIATGAAVSLTMLLGLLLLARGRRRSNG